MPNTVNHWMTPRAKRKLTEVPLMTALLAEGITEHAWDGERRAHIDYEVRLEDAGLKRAGARRDATGSGGRTYMSVLRDMGLVFSAERPAHAEINQDTKSALFLTLAGEALAGGHEPVEVLTGQLLKYQYPNATYNGLGGRTLVDTRFRLRPFVFLLQLLRHPWLDGHLSRDEIAQVVITHGTSNSAAVVDDVAEHIVRHRTEGPESVESDFLERYGAATKGQTLEKFLTSLEAVAHTFMCRLEYSRLIIHQGVHAGGELGSNIQLSPAVTGPEIDAIIAEQLGDDGRRPLIARADEEEVFQRKFGLAPGTQRDNRALWKIDPDARRTLAKRRVKTAYMELAQQDYILEHDSSLIDTLSSRTALDGDQVRRALEELSPQNGRNLFLTQLSDYAQSGTEHALDFERMTAQLFRDVFGLDADNVGQGGREPDIIVKHPTTGVAGIVDNKAITVYSVPHKDVLAMHTTYIPTYRARGFKLAFFLYIAHSFNSGASTRIREISDTATLPGAGLAVDLFIRLIHAYEREPFPLEDLFSLFAKDRVLTLADIEQIRSH